MPKDCGCPKTMHKQHLQEIRDLGVAGWQYHHWMMVFEVVVGHRANCEAMPMEVLANGTVANAHVLFYNK